MLAMRARSAKLCEEPGQLAAEESLAASAGVHVAERGHDTSWHGSEAPVEIDERQHLAPSQIR